MNKLLILLFIWVTSCVKETKIYQSSTFEINPTTIGLSADTTIMGIWDGAGKVIQVNNYKIHGTGTLQNWDIEASVNQQIFDSSINLKNITTGQTAFSTIWYGAKSSNTDNWWYLQKSINVCKDNHLVCFTPGKGIYRYSKTLDISTKLNGVYQQCDINLIGDASYWDRGAGTTFQYTGLTGPAINFQLNKGSVFKYIAVQGSWRAPGGVDSVYFNLTEANYTDQSGLKLPDSFTGVAIDYYYDGYSRSGSSGISMSNISIGGFAKGLAFSANQYTQNDDVNSIDHIHFFDNKWCIVTGQPQEKGTNIDQIYSWGSCYNLLKHFGAGNYSFNGANIAGRCIELVQVSIGHWFSSSIENWYTESIGRVATVVTQMPFTFTDCNFDLNFFTGTASKQRIVVTSNSTFLSFEHCTFRYYDGLINNVYVRGAMTIAAPPENYFGGGSLIYK